VVGSTEVQGYQDGEHTAHKAFRGVAIQSFTDTVGIDRYRDTSHTIFVVDRSVVSHDTWEGNQLPPRAWNAGDVVFLPAKSEITCRPETPYDETIIRVPDRLFHEAARIDIDYGAIDFSYSLVTDFVVGDMVSVIRKVANANIEVAPMLMENLALSLAVSTACALSPKIAKTIATLRNGLSPSRKKRVLSYIEANVGRQVLLTEIAHAAALSPYHFARSFRVTMGMSPMRYLLSRRIIAATIMLKTTLPMITVALDCGFLSHSHFCMAFKASTGKTPSHYRKTWRM
jgi:AraC-like DNA-binding protein